MRRLAVLLCFVFVPSSPSLGWGFFAHKQINKHAVFTLPPAMLVFYKAHLQYIIAHAVNPDKRGYVVTGEAARHYIDLEYYQGSSLQAVPRYWSQAKEAYPQDAFLVHGILPWHIYRMKHALTEAFRKRDAHQILRLSADIGHYIADAHVPLHTSENYDGQLTGQEGIHGLWETRLPELFLAQYDFFVGKAEYLYNPQQSIWEVVMATHALVDSVLRLERILSERFPAAQKYSFEQRGGTLQKVYAIAYARAYHELLAGQVERQARAAVKMIGNFWYTCWVDAGQPDLSALLRCSLSRCPTN